jgi:diketogulonate reductase-like aldo/keto reductase
MQAVQGKGFKIPIVGLGTWSVRDPARIVEQAIRIGYRHIDTAQMYGNETEVGQGIRNSGKRAAVMVTTKVQPHMLAPHDLERSVKESLAKLRTDVIDLLLIHWPNPRVPLSETLGAMSKMKREGYTRAIGVSNFTVALLEEANKVSPEPVVCNQIECHPFLNQDKVIASCRKHDIAVVAYSPIARGGAPGNETLERIGKAHGKTAAQVSLRYLVELGCCVIPRTANPAHMRENLDVFDFKLSDAEMAALKKLNATNMRIVNPPHAPVWDTP